MFVRRQAGNIKRDTDFDVLLRKVVLVDEYFSDLIGGVWEFTLFGIMGVFAQRLGKVD